MINPLNELSSVYLAHIAEQEGDNTPEDVKIRVTQIVKAIRYKARKEGGNIVKAFNDYMGGQSGIGAAERQMVKQKLGLQEDKKEREKTLDKISKDAKDILKQEKLHRKAANLDEDLVDEYIDTVKKVKKAELDQDLKRWSEVEEDYETKKKGEVLGALKKRKGDFKKRYGKDAADVMYAVAAKTAKKKGDTSKSDDRYAYEDVKRDYQGPLYAPHPDLVREGKCEDCTCEGCGPDGVGHQDPCVECGGHHKEMKEGFSNWREDLREIADDIPETEKKMEVKIKEKNVKNKIVINPVLGGSGRDMGEEIKKIGGELLEMTEVEEQVAAGGAVALSPQEVNLAKRQAMLQTRASKARQRTLAKVKAEKEVKEELSDRAKKEVERDARNADNPLHKPGRRTLKQLTYARELALKNQKKKVTKEEVVGEAQELPANIAAALSRLEKKRVRQGGDKKDSPYNAHRGKKLHPSQGKMVGPPPQKKVEEAKVDTGSPEAKASARNVRNTPPGKDSKFDTSVFITRKPGESLDSARTRKRRDAHAAKRGVKEEVQDKQGLDKYDRHKRMIRHKQDKYGRNVIGADYNLENERKAKGWKKKLNKEEIETEGWKPDPVEKRKKKAADLYRREKIAQGTSAKYKTDKTEDPDKLYKRRMAVDSKTKMKEDKAFDNVVSMLRKKHGESGVLTKDSPKPKAQPRPKAKPQKPLTAKEKAQREVDAQYGRTPWNKKGSLGT